jgi:hypothetical protein
MMKKVMILTVLLALSLSTGCKKQLYHFVGTVPITQEYSPNQATGSFSGSDIITKQDVTDVLNLPKNAQIEKVDLQNTGAIIEKLSGNAATQVMLNGTISVGGSTQTLFSNLPVTTDGTYALATLNQPGVVLLTNQIKAFLQDVPGTTSITIAISGTSIPANSVIHVKVTLKIQCNVPSEACIEFPSFISEGEDCPAE